MGQEPSKGYPRIPENSGGGAGNPEDLERSRAEQQRIWEDMAARLSAERGHPVSVAEAKAELSAELSPKP